MLVESSLLVAMAFLLSFTMIYEAPMGGRVTIASMLPIIIIGLRHGTLWGIGSGAVYAVLQFMQEPYFVHPAQILLDYALAFGLLGLSGLFRGRRFGFQIGTVVAVAARFLSHFLAGIIFFREYAPAGQSPEIYSLVYQLQYLVPELVITLVVGTLLIRFAPKNSVIK